MASKTPMSSDSLHEFASDPYNEAVDDVLSVLHGNRTPPGLGTNFDDLEFANASASTSSIFDALLPPILPTLPSPSEPLTVPVSSPRSSTSPPTLPRFSTVSAASTTAQNEAPLPVASSPDIAPALTELLSVLRDQRSDLRSNDRSSIVSRSDELRDAAPPTPPPKRRRIDPSVSRLLQPVVESETPSSRVNIVRSTKRASKRDPMDCPICLEPAPLTGFIGSIRCNHRVCRPCAKRLLISFVSSGSPSLPIRCPHEKCSIEWNVNKCLTLLRSFLRPSTKGSDTRSAKEKEEGALETSTALEKLTELNVKNRHIRLLAYCSNPKCATPFDWLPSSDTCAEDQESRVKCPMCSVETCVECNTEWHHGKTCFDVSLKGAKDEGGFKALVFNQKWTPCPRCGNAVEKVNGCSHIHCACGCDFCYRCGVESRLHKRGRCADWRRAGRKRLHAQVATS